MELAAHRGSFFNAVMQSISSRITPTSSPNVSAEELLQRGVSGVRHLERFGEYGRCRQLNQLQFQVMSVFDYMMAQNFPAATDGLALLAVTIEQVSLDGGRMELTTLLCLQEDPPSSIFMPTVKGGLCTIGGPKVVDMCLGVFEGAGGDQFKPHRELSTGKPASDNSSGAPHSKAGAKPKAKWGKKKGKGKGENEQGGGCRVGINAESDGGAEQSLWAGPNLEINFVRWAVCLPRWMMRCRSRFSWRSFSACWREDIASPTTTFPLPAPHPGCFDSSGPGLRERDLAVLARKRLLRIIVFCLNYLCLGRFPTRRELGRRPNSSEMGCLQRLRALLVVSGADGGSYPIVPGRSGPELGAAFFQVEHFPESNHELTQMLRSAEAYAYAVC